jgi:hypothetical protein
VLQEENMRVEKRLEALARELLKADGGDRLLSLVVGALVGIEPARAGLTRLAPSECKAVMAYAEGLQRLRKRARA